MLLTKALDGTPRKIVSLNPSITEFLFIIGAGNRVIGTDVWSYRPREAMKTVKIGSFTSADIETIKRLSPRPNNTLIPSTETFSRAIKRHCSRTRGPNACEFKRHHKLLRDDR